MTPARQGLAHAPASETAAVQPRPRPAGRRPALDGLRGLAVLAVVGYHFGGGSASVLPGGFLGVDVFFVLSGYLITGLLLAEHARTGRIDLVGFAARRVRRLLPALVVVLLAVCAWIWWATPPDSYPRRRADLLWTLGYLNNWHAIRTAQDYFAGYAQASPLRHAWSLAVEEQFYLAWPLVLAVLLLLARRRAGRRAVAVTCAVGIAASALAMAYEFDPAAPSRAYYGTEGRVQQLFAGALLAVLLPRWLARCGPGRVRLIGIAGAAAAGLLLLAVAVLPDSSAIYYRGGALVAGLAAAAVIAAVETRPGAGLGAALSRPWLVALGAISYGVYLWHWPITVAVPVDGHPAMEAIQRQGWRIGLTLAAAILSWWLVERPVARFAPRRSPLTVAVAAAGCLLAVLAVGVRATELPGPVSRQLADSFDRPCPGETRQRLRACDRPAGSPGTAPQFVLAGDSVARSWQPGLDDWAAGTGRSWVQAAWKECSASGLTAIAADHDQPDRTARTCAQQALPRLRAAVEANPGVPVLVGEYTPTFRDLRDGSGRRVVAGTAEHRRALADGYVRLVDTVAAGGGRVVFVRLPPPGRALGTVLATGRPAGQARTRAADGVVDAYNGAVGAAAARRPGRSSVIDLTDVVCPGGTCGPMADGVLVRTDGVHYSTAFSRLLAPVLLAGPGSPRARGQPSASSSAHTRFPVGSSSVPHREDS